MAIINGQWTELCASKELQRSSQSAAAADGNVYIFGGELIARKPRDSDIFKLTGTEHLLTACSTSSTKPRARVGATMTALGSKLYVFSGRGGEAMTPIDEGGALQVFHTADCTWSELCPADSTAPAPEARSYHCATTDGRNLIYIHAGCPEKGRLRDLWAFDLAQKCWTRLADAPGLPRGGTSIAFARGKLYRMNGFDGKAEIGGSLDVYDPAKDAWNTLEYVADGKSGPAARSVSALLAVNISDQPHLVTLFGEADPSSLGHAGAGKMLSDCWTFSINDGHWKRIKSEGSTVPLPRGWFDAVTTGDAQVVVTGGLADDNERIADAWLLQLS